MKPKPCVYVVEDDPAMTQALESFIGAVGLEYESYQSAEEFLQDFEPDLSG